MRYEQLQEMLERDPFIPFRFYVSDGSVHVVRDPNTVYLTRASMEVARPVRRNNRFALHVQLIDPIHVVRAQFLDQEAVAGQTGN
jgi:hypothetical protein